MKQTRHCRLSAAILAAALAATLCLGLSACETDSTNTSGVVSNNSGTVYDFSSLYRANSDSADGYLVYPADKQSGEKLTWMRIVQNGSSLQGFDNAGQNWTGAISGVEDTTARFSMDGRTTAGATVTIAGTMSYANEQSTISASWLESTGFSGNFFAKGTVSSPGTNTPASTLAISPSSATVGAGQARTFTASGGNGTYTWAHSGSCGTLSGSTGSSIVYTHVSSGTDTLTVNSNGKSASASIVCE